MENGKSWWKAWRVTDEIVDRRHSITGEGFPACRRTKNRGHGGGRAVMAGGNGKGKYLAKKSAALPKITEESLAEAFSSLSGIGEREIILIYNSSDLHTVCRTFPAMTEEELAETMYWEQDRIFGVREDLRLSWKALSEDVTGWTVSLAGVREDSVACWQSAAEKAGRKITRCIPVTAVELPRERRPLYLYGKGKSALFLFREEHVQESRILNTADADKNYKYLSVIS